ncbi:MAG TPA: PfkB family carbohydrate kinase [Phycisphaerales bacterium]|nr:PfkB family carbohydrate kinase [Phycisphaerales bacterium]HMP35953.1 PfkB family carbohydrate kinase [Phycisphaerales bacterium]
MQLARRLAEYSEFSALVVGDFMLDQHIYGAAERLSPDAPVPVLAIDRIVDVPGGASNVALCIEGLRGRVRCAGVVGADAEGRLLGERLGAMGCDTSMLVEDRSRPTTVKRNIVGLAQHRHPQKMFRLDQESRAPLDPEMTATLLLRIEAALDSVDVVCLEDYGKGVCTPQLCAELAALCQTRGRELLVDPAAIDDYRRYCGATVITPNRTEARLALGGALLSVDDPSAFAQIERLRDSLGLEAVVVTLDRDGMLLVERGEQPAHVPTVARQVYDVTGAGDMVLAALAGARANGFGWPEAVRFANAAAGLEVELFGACAVPFVKVRREAMRLEGALGSTKSLALEELLLELQVHRHDGRRVVMTNGCFDVIHAGHVAYLREAKALGDILVVAVNADAEVARQKGPGRPVFPIPERLEILSEMRCVDYVLEFHEPTVDRLLREIRPNLYVKGGDYRPEAINEYGTARELGIEVKVLGWREGLGSREVIRRMLRTEAAVPSVESHTAARDA